LPGKQFLKVLLSPAGTIAARMERRPEVENCGA
jgi:hypothetical protein